MSICKKLFCLLLVATLLFSLNVTVFAAEKAEDQACEPQHIHSWSNEPDIIYVPGAGEYVSPKGCHPYVQEKYTCTTCGQDKIIRSYYSKLTSHYNVAYHATCNGTIQTIDHHCEYCHYNLHTTTKECPGGPHSGPCHYLPC